MLRSTASAAICTPAAGGTGRPTAELAEPCPVRPAYAAEWAAKPEQTGLAVMEGVSSVLADAGFVFSNVAYGNFLLRF